VLAAVVTVAFGIFAYRAAEWSKGVNSEMIVLGQGTITNPCGGGSSTGTSSVQTVKVIPQMAMGSFDGGLTKYSTVIQIVNTSGAVQSITANFYKPDGTALNNVSLTAGTGTITSGVLPETSIATDGVFVISGGGTSSSGTLAWGKITACGGLSISTFFELRDGSTNVLYSRVGVAASPANMRSFVIPRVRELATGLDVGFALVNTAATSANLTAELRDASGAMITTRTVTMAAGAHQAIFTNQFFTGLNDGTGRSYQYLKFTSTSSSFAAIALAFEGPNQTSFPVDVLQ
jgi:hypothetical protein